MADSQAPLAAWPTWRGRLEGGRIRTSWPTGTCWRSTITIAPLFYDSGSETIRHTTSLIHISMKKNICGNLRHLLSTSTSLGLTLTSLPSLASARMDTYSFEIAKYLPFRTHKQLSPRQTSNLRVPHPRRDARRDKRPRSRRRGGRSRPAHHG